MLIGETVRELAVPGMVKALTVGRVVSVVVMVIVTVAFRLKETLLAPSLAQAYRVLRPEVVPAGKEKLVGAAVDQPVAVAEGAVEEVVTM